MSVPKADPCPFGPAHKLRPWWNLQGVACWKCHKTWRRDGDGWTATWAEAAA